MRVILASTSPRRRELLGLLGVRFEIRDPAFEERVASDLSAQDLAKSFSLGKAYSVATSDPEAVVIGSDTLIEFDGGVLGKPRDLVDAAHMLKRMAGCQHAVHTAVTIVRGAVGLAETVTSTALVLMKPFDPDLHHRYLETTDSLGKAGSYSVQGPGSELISELKGDYTTVVGLPLRVVAGLLARAGIAVPVDVDTLYESTPHGTWARFHQPSHS